MCTNNHLYSLVRVLEFLFCFPLYHLNYNQPNQKKTAWKANNKTLPQLILSDILLSFVIILRFHHHHNDCSASSSFVCILANILGAFVFISIFNYLWEMILGSTDNISKSITAVIFCHLLVLAVYPMSFVFLVLFQKPATAETKHHTQGNYGSNGTNVECENLAKLLLLLHTYNIYGMWIRDLLAPWLLAHLKKLTCCWRKRKLRRKLIYDLSEIVVLKEAKNTDSTLSNYLPCLHLCKREKSHSSKKIKFDIGDSCVVYFDWIFLIACGE